MITRVPTQPTDEVTIVMTSDDRVAWASRTPARPITYSPRVMPTIVCLTTSAVDRLNRVMSGVMTAPTMKAPATSVVPCSSDSDGPGAGCVTSVPMSCLVSWEMIDQPTSTTKAGTVMYATHCIEPKPPTTTRVTARPKTSDHAQAGSTPISATRPSAE